MTSFIIYIVMGGLIFRWVTVPHCHKTGLKPDKTGIKRIKTGIKRKVPIIRRRPYLPHEVMRRIRD